jgi:hypothetical protein
MPESGDQCAIGWEKNKGKKSHDTVLLRAWFRFFPHLSEDLVSYSMKG